MKPALTRTQSALLYAAGWLPLYVLFALMLRVNEIAASAAIAVLYATTYVFPAVLVGAVTWQLARRVAWSRVGWLKFAFVEVALDLSFLVVWHAVYLGWLWATAGREVAVANAQVALGWGLLMAVLVVAVHSAVFHAVRIFGQLRERELATAAAETARVRAEMLALRGQLDPHFLFNSLHSITALVREDPHRAEDALLQFGALLRRVLAVKRDSTDEVSLADEMKFVDDYLAIERLRLGDRLRVTTEISDAARACRLPAFSVQPLVENSIRHAIAPRRDGGNLAIRARVTEGRLEILVRDDGPGSEAAKVANATGVGLSVIRQRLRLRHGPLAEVSTDTAPGKGFCTTLTLPADTEGVSA